MSCPHCKRKDAKIVPRDYRDGRHDWMCHACGKAVDDYQPEIFTSEASEIGRLYRQAKTNFVDSVKLLIACGEQLRAQKEKLSHGEWLPWLEANEKELGFGKRTAQTLMDASMRFSTNAQLTAYLTEEEALAVSRQIWGNREPTPSYAPPQRGNRSATSSAPDFDEEPPEPEPRKEKPPSFLKPVIDIPQPPKLDNNPRRCTASCCPAGSDISGPWGIHDAQTVLDDNDFPHGFFREYHAAVLKILVEVDQRHAFEKFRGGSVRSAMVPERPHRYRGVGQGRRQ